MSEKKQCDCPKCRARRKQDEASQQDMIDLLNEAAEGRGVAFVFTCTETRTGFMQIGSLKETIKHMLRISEEDPDFEETMDMVVQSFTKWKMHKMLGPDQMQDIIDTANEAVKKIEAKRIKPQGEC